MTKRLSVLVSLGAASALFVGCGETTEGLDLDTETTVGAYSEASCATATPDQSLPNNSTTTPAVGMTPTTYSNPKCYKAQVFDLGRLSSLYNILVEWTDPWPRTQAQCATTLSMQVYLPEFPSYTFGPITVASKWENGACNLGRLGLQRAPVPTVPPGEIRGWVFTSETGAWNPGPDFYGYSDVRIAVTARTAANSTQSVKVTHRVSPPPPPPPPPPCPAC